LVRGEAKFFFCKLKHILFHYVHSVHVAVDLSRLMIGLKQFKKTCWLYRLESGSHRSLALCDYMYRMDLMPLMVLAQ
jgi:hypothetical protein